MTDSTYSELDEPITQDEIRKATQSLKLNKACSLDAIINKYFKESNGLIVSPLEKLFNYILFVCSSLMSVSTLSVISRRCLFVTGSSMLTFIVLPHCGIRSQTLLPDTPPVTLY